MVKTWLMIALILVIVLMIYRRLGDTQEGFGFAENTLQFTNAQYKYFNKQAGKEILTNPGVALTGINDALRQPDLYVPSSPDRDYSVFFKPDPTETYTEQDNTFCRGVTDPRNLPDPSSAGGRVGCGWYYVPDPSTPSTGALGTRDGPLLREGIPTNGTWIWDRDAAIQQEEIKKCKRIRNCSMIDLPEFKGVCGFCDRLGHGVPILTNGSEKYIDNPDSCGTAPIARGAQCGAPTALVTEDGTACGALGRPSADNTIRIYTKAECDQLNGIHRPNGECLRRGGTGSFSWDCRQLNNPVELSVEPRICDPDARGYLTRACLISIATSLGYNRNGGILKMLNSTAGPTDLDRATLDMLRSAGMLIPDAVLGRGDINAQSASNVYKSIYDRMTTGSTNMVKNSAKHLVIGVDEFDVCEYGAQERGPFSTYCLQRAFREAGCQPAGARNPTERNASTFANMTWGEVNGVFRNLRNSVNSGTASTQDSAVKDCLGVDVFRQEKTPCVHPGMEYLYYSFHPAEILVRGRNEYSAFVGAEYAAGGFKPINVVSGFVGNSGRVDLVGLKVRSIINPVKPINERLDIWTDDGVRVWVNGNMLLDKWWDMPPTQWSVNASVPANKPAPLEIHWYENYGGALLDARGAMDSMNAACFLPYPTTAPVIAYDFFRGGFGDIHGTTQSEAVGMRMVTKAGRRGAQFGSGAHIQILTPFRFKAIRSITCMVYWDDWSSGRGYIFNACRNPQGNSQMNLQLSGGAGFANNVEFAQLNPAPGSGYRINRVGAPKGVWTHYAVVYTGDHQGATLYINGNAVGTDRTSITMPDEILRHIYLGRPVEYPGVAANATNALNATLGWFHMYDRTLTASDVRGEMGYWDNVDFTASPIRTFNTSRIKGRFIM
jgi:hypothetical protein